MQGTSSGDATMQQPAPIVEEKKVIRPLGRLDAGVLAQSGLNRQALLSAISKSKGASGKLPKADVQHYPADRKVKLLSVVKLEESETKINLKDLLKSSQPSGQVQTIKGSETFQFIPFPKKSKAVADAKDESASVATEDDATKADLGESMNGAGNEVDESKAESIVSKTDLQNVRKVRKPPSNIQSIMAQKINSKIAAQRKIGETLKNRVQNIARRQMVKIPEVKVEQKQDEPEDVPKEVEKSVEKPEENVLKHEETEKPKQTVVRRLDMEIPVEKTSTPKVPSVTFTEIPSPSKATDEVPSTPKSTTPTKPIIKVLHKVYPAPKTTKPEEHHDKYEILRVPPAPRHPRSPLPVLRFPSVQPPPPPAPSQTPQQYLQRLPSSITVQRISTSSPPPQAVKYEAVIPHKQVIIMNPNSAIRNAPYLDARTEIITTGKHEDTLTETELQQLREIPFIVVPPANLLEKRMDESSSKQEAVTMKLMKSVKEFDAPAPQHQVPACKTYSRGMRKVNIPFQYKGERVHNFTLTSITVPNQKLEENIVAGCRKLVSTTAGPRVQLNAVKTEDSLQGENDLHGFSCEEIQTSVMSTENKRASMMKVMDRMRTTSVDGVEDVEISADTDTQDSSIPIIRRASVPEISASTNGFLNLIQRVPTKLIVNKDTPLVTPKESDIRRRALEQLTQIQNARNREATTLKNVRRSAPVKAVKQITTENPEESPTTSKQVPSISTPSSPVSDLIKSSILKKITENCSANSSADIKLIAQKFSEEDFMNDIIEYAKSKIGEPVMRELSPEPSLQVSDREVMDFEPLNVQSPPREIVKDEIVNCPVSEELELVEKVAETEIPETVVPDKEVSAKIVPRARKRFTAIITNRRVKPNLRKTEIESSEKSEPQIEPSTPESIQPESEHVQENPEPLQVEPSIPESNNETELELEHVETPVENKETSLPEKPAAQHTVDDVIVPSSEPVIPPNAEPPKQQQNVEEIVQTVEEKAPEVNAEKSVETSTSEDASTKPIPDVPKMPRMFRKKAVPVAITGRMRVRPALVARSTKLPAKSEVQEKICDKPLETVEVPKTAEVSPKLVELPLSPPSQPENVEPVTSPDVTSEPVLPCKNGILKQVVETPENEPEKVIEEEKKDQPESPESCCEAADEQNSVGTPKIAENVPVKEKSIEKPMPDSKPMKPSLRSKRNCTEAVSVEQCIIEETLETIQEPLVTLVQSTRGRRSYQVDKAPKKTEIDVTPQTRRSGRKIVEPEVETPRNTRGRRSQPTPVEPPTEPPKTTRGRKQSRKEPEEPVESSKITQIMESPRNSRGKRLSQKPVDDEPKAKKRNESRPSSPGKRSRSSTLESETKPNKRLRIDSSSDDDDEPLIVKKPVAPGAGYTCGNCKEIVAKSKWFTHRKSHAALAWREGIDETIDMDNEDSWVNIMQRFIKDNNLQFLACPKCKLFTRKSGAGLISHMRICGLTEEELQQTRVACPNCNKSYVKDSLAAHLRSHCPVLKEKIEEERLEMKRQREIEEAEKVVELELTDSGRAKRQSRKKAEENLKSVWSDQVKVFDPEAYLGTKEKKITGGIFRVWRTALNKSKPARCMYNCEHTSQSVEEAQEHHRKCPVAAGFSCTICGHKSNYRVEVIEHIKAMHSVADTQAAADFQADDSEASVGEESSESEGSSGCEESDFESEDDLDDDDDDFSGADDDNDRKQRGPQNKKHNNCVPDTRMKLFKSLVSRFTDHDRPKVATHKYRELNYADLSFAQHKVGKVTLLPTRARQMYEFGEHVSPKVSAKWSKVYSEDAVVDEDGWKSFKLYQSGIMNEFSIFFCGGSISVLEWLPLPASSNIQILAVATSPSYSPTKISDVKPMKCLVQLWAIEKFTNSIVPRLSHPKLLYSLAIENGPVNDLKFCPSGGHTEDRLGLLAVATCSEDILIYALPKSDTEAFILAETYQAISLEPCLVLRSYGPIEGYATKIAWSPGCGHSTLVAGYSNGFVALWNLDTDSKLLTKVLPSGVHEIYSHRCLVAHQSRITALCLHPVDGLEFLVTGSLDRRLKVFRCEDGYDEVTNVYNKSRVVCAQWSPAMPFFPYGVDADYCFQQSEVRTIFTPGFAQDDRNNGPLMTLSASVTDISVNEWTNVVAIATTVGDVYMHYSPNYFSESKKRRKEMVKMVTSYVDEVKEDSTGSGKSGTSRIVFNDLDKVKHYQIQKSDIKLRTEDITHASLARANKIAFNPNANAFNCYAIGYESGFVRLRKALPI